MTTLTFAVFALALAGGSLGLLIWRLSPRRDLRTSDLAWLESFDRNEYRPMLRLLRENDYSFLAAQPGYAPGISRRLRKERTGVLRMYLRQLAGDFHRLARIADLMLVHSGVDRPEMADEIWRVRITFYGAMFRAHLLVNLGGFPAGRLKAADLLSPLDAMFQAVTPLSHAADRN